MVSFTRSLEKSDFADWIYNVSIRVMFLTPNQDSFVLIILLPKITNLMFIIFNVGVKSEKKNHFVIQYETLFQQFSVKNTFNHSECFFFGQRIIHNVIFRFSIKQNIGS